MLEKTFESPLDCKETKPVHPKGNKSWIFTGRTEAKAPILWPPDLMSPLIRKRPRCWERLKAGGEGDARGWDGWMASPTRWTWVWVNSRSWWWIGRPGVLSFMGLQRVGCDWAISDSLIMMCISLNLFVFIPLGFYWASWIFSVIFFIKIWIYSHYF